MNDFPCWQFTYLFVFHAACEKDSDVSSPSADEFKCTFCTERAALAISLPRNANSSHFAVCLPLFPALYTAIYCAQSHKNQMNLCDFIMFYWMLFWWYFDMHYSREKYKRSWLFWHVISLARSLIFKFHVDVVRFWVCLPLCHKDALLHWIFCNSGRSHQKPSCTSKLDVLFIRSSIGRRLIQTTALVAQTASLEPSYARQFVGSDKSLATNCLVYATFGWPRQDTPWYRTSDYHATFRLTCRRNER